MRASKNLEMLAVVARGLRELKDQVVFVGGATVDLYVAAAGGAPLRTTDDVDCVIGITSRVAYSKLEEKLRELGFAHPIDDPKAPICRWRYSGISVDVMPMDGSVLGFSNRWYPDGVASAVRARLPDGGEVSIFTLPIFLASKLEAFLGRGKGDFYGSADIEDIVAVVDGAEDFAKEMERAPAPVRAYFKKEVGELIGNELFADSVLGHLGPQAEPGRAQRVLELLRALVG